MEAVKVGQRFTDVEAMGKEKEKHFPVLHRLSHVIVFSWSILYIKRLVSLFSQLQLVKQHRIQMTFTV